MINRFSGKFSAASVRRIRQNQQMTSPLFTIYITKILLICFQSIGKNLVFFCLWPQLDLAQIVFGHVVPKCCFSQRELSSTGLVFCSYYCFYRWKSGRQLISARRLKAFTGQTFKRYHIYPELFALDSTTSRLCWYFSLQVLSVTLFSRVCFQRREMLSKRTKTLNFQRTALPELQKM